MAASVSEIRRRESDFASECEDFVRVRQLFEARRADHERERARNEGEVGALKADVEGLKKAAGENRKLFEDACQRANGELKRERDRVQALQAEVVRVGENFEGLHDMVVAKDQEILASTARVSTLEAEKSAWAKEKELMVAAQASLEEGMAQLTIERNNAYSLMEAATKAQAAGQDDINWMMSAGVSGVFKRIWDEPQLADSVKAIAVAAERDGRRRGIAEGHRLAIDGRALSECPLQREDTSATFKQVLKDFEDIQFEVLEVVKQCAQYPSPVRELRECFEDSERQAAGGSGSFWDAARGG